jgi:5-methylcytosine-specific restriction endonuclease McrA
VKNLTPYSLPCFAFHQLAVSRKENVDLRARLEQLDAAITDSYATYAEHFDANTLELILEDATYQPHSEDLKELYDFDSYAVRQFRTAVEGVQPDSIRYTCQNCGIDSTGEIDHFLPSSKYPQFIVNPSNMLPVCGKCNGKKNAIWIENGKRVFLNLYIDQLPAEEFLFVDVFFDDDDKIDFKFTISNPNNIDDELYELIESHFLRLGLLERMKRAAIGHLSEFQNTVRRSLRTSSQDLVRQTTLEQCAEDQAAYGNNHWKIALHKALISSQVFFDTIPPQPA